MNGRNMNDQEVSLPTHAIRLRDEKSFLEGKVFSGWTTGMWDAQIQPDSFHIVCYRFMINIFPYSRVDHENRMLFLSSQSGRAIDGNLDETSHPHLSLQSVLSVLSSLCSSQQPWAGYLVLACWAEVSLLSDMWTLSVCCVWSTHQSVQNRHTPSRVCACL